MKWWLALLLLSVAAALPQDKERHARRVLRGGAAPQIHAQAGARIAPPVRAAAKRVQVPVRLVPAKTAARAPAPLRATLPQPFKTTQPKFHRVPAFGALPPGLNSFPPDTRTLTKEQSEALQRQIQQWQIAVVGGQIQPAQPQPPGAPPAYPGGPAYPAGPGTIWIQVPAGAYPYPPPTQPQAPAPPAPPTAVQGSELPPEEEASEGEEPIEEAPAGGGEEAPAGGGEEAPAGGGEEAPAGGETPTPEAPSEGPSGGSGQVEEPSSPEAPATPEETPGVGGGAGGGGDEQEDKLVHCKEARGQFAHEASCSKFYNCWDDVVVETTCPKGLVFSEEHSYCDFPENVDCGQRSTEDISPPIEEQGGCSTAYGSYRSQTNCSEFFICDNGVPIKFACPSELFYNDELGVCDYPYRVDCENPPPAPEAQPPAESAPGGEAPEEQPPPTAEAPAPDTTAPEAPVPDALRGLPPSFLKAGSPCWHSNIYPLNSACSRVAVCRSGTTSILACPRGMAYDVYKRRCLPHYRARC